MRQNARSGRTAIATHDLTETLSGALIVRSVRQLGVVNILIVCLVGDFRKYGLTARRPCRYHCWLQPCRGRLDVLRRPAGLETSSLDLSSNRRDWSVASATPQSAPALIGPTPEQAAAVAALLAQPATAQNRTGDKGAISAHLETFVLRVLYNTVLSQLRLIVTCLHQESAAAHLFCNLARRFKSPLNHFRTPKAYCGSPSLSRACQKRMSSRRWIAPEKELGSPAST